MEMPKGKPTEEEYRTWHLKNLPELIPVFEGMVIHNQEAIEALEDTERPFYLELRASRKGDERKHPEMAFPYLRLTEERRAIVIKWYEEQRDVRKHDLEKQERLLKKLQEEEANGQHLESMGQGIQDS